MILLIDIGNTDTTIGCFVNEDIRELTRISTMPGKRSPEELDFIISGILRQEDLTKPSGAVICSVVPDEAAVTDQAVRSSCGISALHVNEDTATGLTFRGHAGYRPGPDRIANAVAACRLYSGNVIILDIGTATTICLITEDCRYIGGAIMPGPATAMQSLADRTAKVPAAALHTPETVLGKNTEENIQAGVIIGHAGALEKIINEILSETGLECKVVATGGLASIIKPHIRQIDYINPLLTLEGLRLMYEMNR